MAALVGLAALSALALAPTASATKVPSSPTLTLSIPGPITGCSYYGSGANDSLRAILDLVRPSAFLNDTAGNLVGANGPVTGAELTSLTPQTVVYTLDTTWTWSNGEQFDALDLLAWYHRSLDADNSLADGYRAIGTLTPNTTLDKLTVVFSRPYADWALLFRDMEERDAPAACTLDSLPSRPSLGPYRLVAINPSSATLELSTTWKGAEPRFSTVRIKTNLDPLRFPKRHFVDYRLAMSPLELTHVTNMPSLDGHIGSSDRVVVVGYSPHRWLTNQLAVRQFLSWSLDRQHLVNEFIGPLTYAQSPGASVLFTQGQKYYPGQVGLGPFAQAGLAESTSIPTSTDQDCLSCAAPALLAAGFHVAHVHWVSPTGTLLRATVAVGPSALDHAVAATVVSTWQRRGILATTINSDSDRAAVATAAHGRADVAIATEILSPTTSLNARNWTSRSFAGGYDLGWRSTLIDQWYVSAQQTFNPTDAIPTWRDVDQQISSQSWIRPLFSLPSLQTWSNDVAGVYGSISLVGFVDEISTWGVVSPNTATP